MVKYLMKKYAMQFAICNITHPHLNKAHIFKSLWSFINIIFASSEQPHHAKLEIRSTSKKRLASKDAPLPSAYFNYSNFKMSIKISDPMN